MSNLTRLQDGDTKIKFMLNITKKFMYDPKQDPEWSENSEPDPKNIVPDLQHWLKPTSSFAWEITTDKIVSMVSRYVVQRYYMGPNSYLKVPSGQRLDQPESGIIG